VICLLSKSPRTVGPASFCPVGTGAVFFVARLRLKCEDTRAENRFRLSAKRTNPFKSAGVSVQSTTGSRCVRISSSNAGYIMFRDSVKSTGYPLRSPVSPSLPLMARLYSSQIPSPVIHQYSSTLVHSTHAHLPVKMEQSVPKRRYINFRRRGITQKEAYNI
jgi:hypothetical protein